MTAAIAPPPATSGLLEAQCSGPECERWVELDQIGRVGVGGPLLCWLCGDEQEGWQPLVELDDEPEPEPAARPVREPCGCTPEATCSELHQRLRDYYSDQLSAHRVQLDYAQEAQRRVNERIRQMMGQTFGADFRFPGARGV